MKSAESLLDLLDLAARNDGVWIGPTPAGRGRPNLLGGLVSAQALRAAQREVGPDYRTHLLHAYFLSAGRFGEDLTFQVLTIRDGRSFSVRAVEVTQSGQTILTMTASFQVPESGDRYEIDREDPAEPPEHLNRSGTGIEAGTGGQGLFVMVEDSPDTSGREV